MLISPHEASQLAAKPFNGGVVELPFPGRLDRDMHHMLEIGVLLTGQEERHIDDHVATLSPGDVWLCAAWEPHGWRATAPGTQELSVLFLPDILGGEVFDGLSYMTLFSMPPADRPRVTTTEKRALALAIAEEVRREMAERRRGWLATVRLCVMRLLLALSRDWHPVDESGKEYNVRPGNLARVMPAVRLVHSQPARRLSVSDAAAVCGLSGSQFAFLFRNAMGLSYGKFCMRVRLAYAAQLLLKTELPVEAVAEAAGFADASHLHHAFARVYHHTPARYRADIRCSQEVSGFTVIEYTSIEDQDLLKRAQEGLDRAVQPRSTGPSSGTSAP